MEHTGPLEATTRTAFEHVVATVGENPLPMTAALLAHLPSTVTLVHTHKTASGAQAIRRQYLAVRPETAVRLVLLEDPNRAECVRNVLAGLGSGWVLDYTGGTKVMAAQARLALHLAGGTPSSAYYVDDRRQAAVFDDGTETPLRPVSLTLEAIADLHGAELHPDVAQHRTVLADTTRGYLQPGLIKEDLQFIAARLDRRRSSRDTGGAGAPGRRFERVVAWAATNWLQHHHPEDSWEVIHSVRQVLGRSQQDAEVDVVIRLGYQLGVISCSFRSGTKEWSLTIKRKLQEAAVRGHRLGGSRTRIAVATNVAPRPGDAYLRALDEARSLGITPPAAVFHREHLRAWIDGKPDGLDVFERWFDGEPVTG